ncbi:MAG: hypothetical protein Q7R47_07000 [Candidatus Diapherotrites archaeon]|nr:hypothetical protein [Candidatus Diapherotrites archaeon]
MVLEEIPNSLGQTTQVATPVVLPLLNDPVVLAIGIGLVILTIFLLLFLKKIIVNSIVGAVLWGLATFVFHVQLPFLPSLLIALIFGPAGIGVFLVLRFLGYA